jgi:hypothetical protein
MHSIIANEFNSQANSALHIWEKCSGFEETSSIQTRWLKEPDAIAYWDEHQCNAITLAEKSAFFNRFVERILHYYSVAKTHNSDNTVEESGTELAYQTFRSGLTVLGDDSEFVYYAFQYYLPKKSEPGYFVGVLRISKDLLLRPESLGEWFDGIHPLGFLKHDENGWYWSREINRHIQILTPVGRIRRINWAQPDPNAKHYLASSNDMGPNDFDMGAASIMPCMIFGRNDSSSGYVYGRVVEDGDDTIIYLHVGDQISGNATNATHAESMVAPSTNSYSLSRSNRKAFMVDRNNNPTSSQDYGQMYNPKIYRLKVSKSRVYSGWMYLLPPDSEGRRYVQFDFANPFDGSLECLNDDTYYELTYHPDVLSSEVVGEETKFYIDPNNPDHLTRWSSERWGYWYRHPNQNNANDPNNANLRGIRHSSDTGFYVARFTKVDNPRARLYTHVFAVHYKTNSSNNRPYPDFSDIRHGWVEWDVPGFLWDNLGSCTRFGRTFVVDPFNKGEKNRLLVSIQVVFPNIMNTHVSNSRPLGLYTTSPNSSRAFCTVLFDVRREIVDNKPVWKWYALFPNGLLYFSAPFYRSDLPNLPTNTTRFESNIILNPQEYADTVCYNWLEQNNFKVKVNPSHVNIGTGAVDLLGRYRLSSSENYRAVSFVNSPYGYLPFTLRSNRSPSLVVGIARDVETPIGTTKEIDVYLGSASSDLSLESIWMFNTNNFNVMPSPLAFRILGNISTSTQPHEVSERIRLLGNSLFKTRDFKPGGYYHTLARNLSLHNANMLRYMINPFGAIVRFTIKDVPEYNLLGSSSPVNYIPIDPVNTTPPNRISVLDNFKIVLENSNAEHWKGILVHYANGILFAAYARRSQNPNTPYQNYLFMSISRGESWIAVKIPLISNGFSSLDIHPQTFDFVICGLSYPMVFRSVGYREFVRRLLINSTGLDKLPLRRYELTGRKRL